MELIASGDTLNVGRIAINNWYTGSTFVWSGGTGGNSIKSVNGSNTSSGLFTIVAGKSNIGTSTYATILNGSGHTANNNFAFIINGKTNLASGSYSSILNGSTSTASGSRSFIGQGRNCTATNVQSTVLNGWNCNALGTYSSIINGFSNTASGGHSIVLMGQSNTASGNWSIAGGASNVASDVCSVAIGKSNAISGTYSWGMGKSHTVTHSTAFAIGNGATSDDNSQMVMAAGGGNTIKFDFINGNGYFDGSSDIGSADVAELFEWADVNENNENRWGFGVSLDENGKIKIGGDYIIGITSPTPGIVCDSSENTYKHKYEVDEWGIRLKEEFKSFYSKELEKMLFVDSNNVVYNGIPNSSSLKNQLKITDYIEIPENTEIVIAFKLNPNYNQNEKYISRRQRKEWVPIGLLGKLLIRTAENIIGKYVDINNNGMAVNGTTYPVLEKEKDFDGNYGIVKVLFK